MPASRHSRASNPTIFGKIIRGEIPAKVVYETDDVLAFHDIHPVAPVHVVIIPKDHIQSLQHVGEADAALMGKLLLAANAVADRLDVRESGYRLIANAGADAGQEVPHLHFHLVAGKSLGPKILA
jgi:histidine triad (HIT) family protein